jgi:hypothetical protein
MKSIRQLMLCLSLTAMGLFGLQGSAMALTTMNANICQLTDLSPGPGIFRSGGSITNFAADRRVVRCPIIRTSAAPAAGYNVFVDGSTAAGNTVICSLESYNFDGRFLGLASLVIDTTGASNNFHRLLTLQQSLVPTFSSQVLSCSLPRNASLFDIQSITP